MPPTSTMRRTHRPQDENRRSSGRQIRTSISRPTNYYARPFGSIAGAEEPRSVDEPGLFPAIQYFTDAVTALPKEVMRHFTLMKEVEAKVHGPTQDMTHIATRIAQLPPPAKRAHQPSHQAFLSFTANNSSAPNSASTSLINGMAPGRIPPSVIDALAHVAQPTAAEQQQEMYRRQEFYNLRMVIAQVLINLDEKNVCLAEANRTLDRQIWRLDHVMPHVEGEVSEEVRLGSKSHWAYADIRQKPVAQAVPERSRRDVAATSNLAAAAAAIHEGDIAAARNEGRKETKKGRAQHVDSEFEERPVPKKSHKARKPEAVLETKVASAIAQVYPQPVKKRRVEKVGGSAMERSASTTKQKPPVVAARSTPAVEPPKKKTRPVVPPLAKKKHIGGSPLHSPRMAASPLVSAFTAGETSAQRPSSRMRQNSSTLQHSTSARNASPPKAPERKINGEKRTNGDAKNTAVDSIETTNADVDMEDADQPTEDVRKDGARIDEKPGNVTPRYRYEQDANDSQEPESSIQAGMRKNGPRSVDSLNHKARTSGSHTRNGSNAHILKQIASFNRSPTSGRRETGGSADESSTSEEKEVPPPPPRVGRSMRRQTSKMRSPSPLPNELEPEPEPVLEVPAEVEPEAEPEEEEAEHDMDDPDEPKYCYCGMGSYGTMIGCENENCEREWFHLECTELKNVPGDNVKWYCDDCDPKIRKKAKSGRH